MAVLPFLGALAACDGDVVAPVGNTPGFIPIQASCQNNDAAPFARIDLHATAVVRGPCGRVAYQKTDGSLWLAEPGRSPRQLAKKGSSPEFAKTGTLLAYMSDHVVIHDFETGRSQAVTGIGSSLTSFGFVYDQRASKPAAILYASDSEGVAKVDALGNVKRIADVALNGALRVVAAARSGGNVIALRHEDHALVAIDVASERAIPLANIELYTSYDGSQDGRDDHIALSEDGLVLIHQQGRSRLSGDTIVHEDAASSLAVATDTGVVIGTMPPMSSATGTQPATLIEADSAGHILGISGADSFAMLDSDRRLHSFSSVRLTGLLEDGTAITESLEWPNRGVGLTDVHTRATERLFEAEDGVRASRAGARFAGSKSSDRCISYTDQQICHTQLWELMMAPRGGPPARLAFAEQPIEVQWVSDAGDVLVNGPLFEGDPPLVSDDTRAVHPWREVLIKADGSRVDVGVPALERVAMVGQNLAAISREGPNVTLWAVNPSTGAARALSTAAYEIEMSADPSDDVLVALVGDRADGELWAGVMPSP